MKQIIRILSVFFFVLLFGGQVVFPQGNLLVAPVRVVFEGNKQREDLNLSNIGQDTASYLISFVNYEMLKDGSFVLLADTDNFKTLRSDSLIRVFPRRVELPPGESQIVRLQFRKPQGLAEGEYRSHLYFRADKKATPLGLAVEDKDSTRLSVSITPIFGITIPIIVRNGNLDVKVTLSDVSATAVNDSVFALSVSINRSGTKSAYGTLEATFVPEKGDPLVLGLANGVGVYTELSNRVYTLPLRINKDLDIHKGKLLVRFLTSRDEGSKVLASTEYKFP